MCKYKFFLIIILLGLCHFMLMGCLSSIATIELKHNIQFKVNNPGASYFDIKKRMELIETLGDEILLYSDHIKNTKFINCNSEVIKPLTHCLRLPRYYDNIPKFYLANAPLALFESYVTDLAELYIIDHDPKYVKCLVNVLSKWADSKSLTAFSYTKDNKQAWFSVEWTTASAGFAYSIVKDSPVIQKEKKQKIETWLNKVATILISYSGGPTSCCNNHSYWRGLAATIVGVISNDDSLFRFGIKKYISALKAMNKDGSFTLEMNRGTRAIHYQNFAILPLVYIAEIANRQGYNLYDLSIDGKNLHLAIQFLMKAIENPDKVQDMSFLWPGHNLNWMEPYNQRFHNNKIEFFLKRHRPLSNRYGGGNSTLYFFQPKLE